MPKSTRAKKPAASQLASGHMTMDKLALLTQSGFIELGKEISKVNDRMDKLETVVIRSKNETEKKLDDLSGVTFSFKHDMSSHLDHIYKKLEDLETENHSSFAQYKRHDDVLINHESRISKLETS